MKKKSLMLALAVLCFFLAGCAFGKESVLFTTVTGVAIDVDSEPPRVNIGYERHEGVLAPVFEDGEVLPVLTTVGTRANIFDFSAQHSYATGDAALVMSDYLAKQEEYPFGAPATERVARPEMNGRIIVPKGDKECTERKRYFFGTDTSFGLGVQFHGEYPRAVSMGWKRKEFAYVPLLEKTIYRNAAGDLKNLSEMAKICQAELGMLPPTKENIDAKAREKGYAEMANVRLASLIATADVDASWKAKGGVGSRINQTYATGAAATQLAKHPEVRKVLVPVLVSADVKNETRKIEIQRSKEIVSPARQERVDKLLGDIAGMDGNKAKELMANPPVELDDEMKELIKLRDPGDLRLRNANAAKQILKMLAVMGKRSDEDLTKWEAAIKALE